jgi:hypothetical protein
MSAHSPGPWRWAERDGDDCLLDAAGEEVIAGERACLSADARLIAAAPELLEALRGVLLRPLAQEPIAAACALIRRIEEAP